MGRNRKGRVVDGILLLNKPKGISSNQALQQAKRFYQAQKAGHTGSLDPMATGVLPLCFGEATKLSQYLLNADKAYRATIRLGQHTASGDSEGEILSESDASALTREDFLAAMELFRGDIRQIPPMFSALKVNGQPLYKLAREGKEIEREAREVTVRLFQLLDFRPGKYPEAEVSIECSKGTYIRSIAIDIGRHLGVGGHLVKLHRFQVGRFHEDDALAFTDLQEWSEQGRLDDALIPAEMAVNHLPLVELNGKSSYHLRLGQAVPVSKAPELGLVRIIDENGQFLGIGEAMEDGRVAPRRLVAAPHKEK